MLIAGCAATTPTPRSQPTATLVPYHLASPAATRVFIPPSPLPAPTFGPSPTPFTHEVQENETLSGIALRYGVDLDELLAANPGVDPRLLSIGQKLIIPGPEGTGSQGFFPTPTPVPLAVSEVRCFPDGLDGTWCLVSVQADSEGAVEAVAVAFTLFDSRGGMLAADVAYSPLHFIPAGGAAPLGARFQIPARDIAQAKAQVVRAFAAQGSEIRYAPIEVAISMNEPESGGRAWHVTGSLRVGGEAAQGASRLVLQAIGMDGEGQTVGNAVWQHDGEIQPGEEIGFSLRVYSLGAPIEAVEVIAQGLALSP